MYIWKRIASTGSSLRRVPCLRIRGARVLNRVGEWQTLVLLAERIEQATLFSTTGLKKAGFEGFRSVTDLLDARLPAGL